MDNELKDKILNMFVSSDSLRENMEKPWTYKNLTGATCGHRMVLIQGKDERYQETTLNIDSVMPIDNQYNRIIKIGELKTALDSIPKIEKMDLVSEKCDECDGSGYTNCGECGQEIECPDCKGEGEVEKDLKPTGIFIFDHTTSIAIDETVFNAGYISDVVAVSEIIGIDSLNRKTPPTPHIGNLFEINNEVSILVMPMRVDVTDATANLKNFEGSPV